MKNLKDVSIKGMMLSLVVGSFIAVGIFLTLTSVSADTTSMPSYDIAIGPMGRELSHYFIVDHKIHDNGKWITFTEINGAKTTINIDNYQVIVMDDRSRFDPQDVKVVKSK